MVSGDVVENKTLARACVGDGREETHDIADWCDFDFCAFFGYVSHCFLGGLFQAFFI